LGIGIDNAFDAAIEHPRLLSDGACNCSATLFVSQYLIRSWPFSYSLVREPSAACHGIKTIGMSCFIFLRAGGKLFCKASTKAPIDVVELETFFPRSGKGVKPLGKGKGKGKGVKPLLCLAWRMLALMRGRPPPVPNPLNTSLESQGTKRRGLTPFKFSQECKFLRRHEILLPGIVRKIDAEPFLWFP
jgi:hypothetical protein